jgi:hypothetical protein
MTPRHRRQRTLADHLARASRRAGVAWCSLALAGVAVYLAPPYVRFYG